MNLKRAVVTGFGAITPIGNNVNEYRDSLFDGKSGASKITFFDTSKFRTQFACEVKGFNPEEHFGRKEARKMDRCSQLAMISSEEAIKMSGLNLEEVNKDRIGVIWGSGIGGLQSLHNEVAEYARGDGTPRFSPFFIPRMIVDITPGLLSIKYGFKGPNFATVSACASSNHAINDALNYIRLGKAEIILAGGSEAGVVTSSLGGFSAMKALSTRNDDPTTASRPYDRDRDGFVLGEGSGALILEELEHAKARGAVIYAEVLGGGMSADAYHITTPHPKGDGVKIVMKEALKDANLIPSDIDYINTHGTSTKLGDVSELKGIINVFDDHAYKLNISSTKSMTGHLLGSAGAIEGIACLFAISDGAVPPTINHSTLDDCIDSKLNLTLNKTQHRNIDVAMSNTFGFGGHNTSIIFGKFKEG